MSKEIRNLGIVLCAVLAISFLVYKFAVQNTAPVYVETTTTVAPVASMVGNFAATHSFSSGPIDAKVTVVEFFDPECEACASVAPYIQKEMKFYEGKVRWVFRYMAYHYNSMTALKVLEAARKQNLFLETQHMLFETQKIWGSDEPWFKNTKYEKNIIYFKYENTWPHSGLGKRIAF